MKHRLKTEFSITLWASRLQPLKVIHHPKSRIGKLARIVRNNPTFVNHYATNSQAVGHWISVSYLKGKAAQKLVSGRCARKEIAEALLKARA